MIARTEGGHKMPWWRQLFRSIDHPDRDGTSPNDGGGVAEAVAESRAVRERAVGATAEWHATTQRRPDLAAALIEAQRRGKGGGP